jgi:bifunctional non-homologous end joining protein LigD
VASTRTVTKKLAEIEKTAEVTNDLPISFGPLKVPVTHWNKVFWPEENITKGDVVNYYISIADYILPYLKNRPQSLKRNPGGITDKGFFHKDAGVNVPSFVETIALYSESSDKEIDYIVCNNKATLTYLNNLGCIEINPWHSTLQDLEYPDYLIIDIDPSDKNTFEQVIDVANVVHEILEKAGAVNFCKTSGATGLHVYIPTQRKYTYDQLKDFAELICVMTHEQLPETTSMERSISKRGNKIYLDHLQNRKGQTIAAAYSLRPYPGATASAPLKWEEVKSGLTPAQFTIYTLPARVQKTGDLFKGILGKGINMETCLKKMG